MSSIKGIKPPKNKKRLTLHPISNTLDYIMDLLISFGFEVIDGPEIETEEFNFDMLNIKESHPVSMQILYVNKKSYVLRTHVTSSDKGDVRKTSICIYFWWQGI